MSRFYAKVIDDATQQWVNIDAKYADEAGTLAGLLPSAFEKVANRNQANGYVGLDVTGKIPLQYLYDTAKKQIHVVATKADMLALTTMLVGDGAYIQGNGTNPADTGDTYLYTSSGWVLQADADWANVQLSWGNINGVPDAFPPESHTHTATEVSETDTRKWVSPTEKSTWNNMQTKGSANTDVNSIKAYNFPYDTRPVVLAYNGTSGKLETVTEKKDATNALSIFTCEYNPTTGALEKITEACDGHSLEYAFVFSSNKLTGINKTIKS